MNGSKFAIGTMAVCTAVVASVSALNAETLTWTGKYSDIWDRTEKNWTNSVGEEVAFVNYSDALFNDDAERFTVRFADRDVHAKQIIFDTAKTYTLTNDASYQYIYSATAIRKRGSGRLNFHPYTSILLHMVSEGVFVEEGTAAFSGQGALQYFRLNPEKTFFVGTNAVLHFETRNIFNSDMSEPVSVPIVVKNGTFKASDVKGHVKIGPLTLDDATFDYSGLRGYAGYGVMTFSGKLTFKGETPYELLQDRFLVTDDNKDFRYFSLWSEPKTEFCVDDITGDAAQDVTIGTMLSDHCTNHNPKIVKIPGGLVKTGAGTLALTNALNSFCGDIEVREGTLQAGPDWQFHAPGMVNDPSVHWLGCLTNEGRRITVKSGASLYLPNRNCLGQQLGITNLSKNINVKLVFDGGAFTNYPGQGFLLPDLEFSNGGFIAAGYGASGYGRFMVKEKFMVSGNVPFSWELSQAAFTDTTQNRMSQEALSLNGYPENIFEIADVTDDAEADATFGIPFMIGNGYFRYDTATGDHFLDDWKFGFRKTGPARCA